MPKTIDYVIACKIGRLLFGCGVAPVKTRYNFVIITGSFRLQIVRECTVTGQVYCRLELFSGIVGQELGYFYYDVENETISSLRKED